MLMCLLLLGCSDAPTVTLVLCKTTDNGIKYYYDTNENYYWLKPGENRIYPINDIGLKAEPALVIDKSKTAYSLLKEQPTRYTGTFDDVCGYVNTLESSGYAVTVSESTPTQLDIQAVSDTCSVRVIYIAGDCVRIYCIDNNGLSCDPVLL